MPGGTRSGKGWDPLERIAKRGRLRTVTTVVSDGTDLLVHSGQDWTVGTAILEQSAVSVEVGIEVQKFWEAVAHFYQAQRLSQTCIG